MRYNGEVINSTVIAYTTTGADKPGPPMIRTIQQIKQDVKISWTSPGEANGPLTAYLIKAYELPYIEDDKRNDGDNITLPFHPILIKKYKVGETWHPLPAPSAGGCNPNRTSDTGSGTRAGDIGVEA